MDKYDTIIVGTGFASTFFLYEYLKHASDNERILVLERGYRDDHAWQVEHQRNARIGHRDTFEPRGDPSKGWLFTVAFGGGSNCWWACTPRMLPNDFRMQSVYGVGRDWPFGYDELEPYYQEVEEIMNISGPDYGGLYPRSAPFPLPPHRFSDPDMRLKERYPDLYFQQPTARASVATERRGQCCANSLCHLCPVNAKFTIANDLAHLYGDPRVELRLQTEVLSVETAAGRAQGVTYSGPNGPGEAQADLVVLGANALFNAAILLRSGFDDAMLGKGLTEQASIYALAYLDGVDNFQGSTVITGHGYMLYDGPHRARNAGCLIESWNRPEIRPERGKWRQFLRIKLIFEDLYEERNHVTVPAEGTQPILTFEGYSDYTRRGIEWASRELPRVFDALPVERLDIEGLNDTEAHILGGTVMGRDPQDSVVDPDLIHHRVRNLVTLGSGVFPSCAPANPTLTLSTLSLRSARRLFGGRSTG